MARYYTPWSKKSAEKEMHQKAAPITPERHIAFLEEQIKVQEGWLKHFQDLKHEENIRLYEGLIEHLRSRLAEYKKDHPQETKMQIQPPDSKCIAQLTMKQYNGEYIVVKVYDEATYNEFYWFFPVVGKPWKISSRGSDRLEDLVKDHNAHRAYNHSIKIEDYKIEYFDCARYEELMSATPADLGISRPLAAPVPERQEPIVHEPKELTLHEQYQVAAFHRRESRKLGLRR
jgi:hypothetical protein